MHGQWAHQSQVITFVSGASISAACPIDGANRIGLEFPAFGTLLGATTCNAFVQVCETSDGTFRRLQDVGIYSASSGIQDWEIPSSTGDKMVLCRPAVGFNYLKVHLSTAATDGYTMTVHKLF